MSEQIAFDRLSLHIRELYLVRSVDIGVDISIGAHTNEPVKEGVVGHGKLVRCRERKHIHAVNEFTLPVYVKTKKMN